MSTRRRSSSRRESKPENSTKDPLEEVIKKIDEELTKSINDLKKAVESLRSITSGLSAPTRSSGRRSTRRR